MPPPSNRPASTPPVSVCALLDSELVTPRTRAVLEQRLEAMPAAVPRFFPQDEMAALTAVLARLFPQSHPPPDALAAAIDSRLADGNWRRLAL